MRTFEVPYNFDFKLLEKLKQSEFKETISCIYLPCFYRDGDNSRQNLFLEEKYPKSWEEYKNHLFKIFGVASPAVLFQKNVLFETIEKYYNLGVRTFCLTNDEIAKEIKDKYKDTKTILSITRCLTDTELKENDFSMYNKIVLPFRYCRSIQLYKTLPNNVEYVLIPNSHCLYNCTRCKTHWSLKEDNLEKYYEKERNITSGYCIGIYSDERSYICPSDLKYFDEYVSDYKLVDRLECTEIIMEYFINYNTNLDKQGKGKSWYELKGDEV